MREINKIIVHCSDSEFGDRDLIDRWHRERGWNGIGYHYVICNGFPQHGTRYIPEHDGLIQEGRTLETVGAHCKGHNKDSIGICLIGRRCFTAKQLYDSLPRLLRSLLAEYGLHHRQVFGHRDFNKMKTCPNFDIALVQTILDRRI